MKQRYTVLVVDDEPDLVQTVQELLRYDYRVPGAYSGEEGLEVLKREEVHVLMTDQRMPRMSGVELLRHARAMSPETVRILFTGYADVRDVIDAINLGNVYHYLTKPWEPDVLEATIADAAKRYESTAARTAHQAELERANRDLLANERLRARFLQTAGRRLDALARLLVDMAVLAAARGDDAPAQRAWVERLGRTAGRLRDGVDRLTAAADRGRYDGTLEPQAVELAALLREVEGDARPFADALGQTLRVELADGLGNVTCDPAYLRDGLTLLLVHLAQGRGPGGDVALSALRGTSGVELRVRGGADEPDASFVLAITEFFKLMGVTVAVERGTETGAAFALTLT